MTRSKTTLAITSKSVAAVGGFCVPTSVRLREKSLVVSDHPNTEWSQICTNCGRWYAGHPDVIPVSFRSFILTELSKTIGALSRALWAMSDEVIVTG